ncbi:MAG: hypothetical protein WCH40_06470 [Verrucomicrobiales bacterium]
MIDDTQNQVIFPLTNDGLHALTTFRMCRRTTTKGREVPAFSIDADIAHLILQHKWVLTAGGSTLYAMIGNESIRLAQYVWLLKRGETPPRCIHVDGDGLNNSISNLHPARALRSIQRRTCSGPRCSRLAASKGLCRAHYLQLRKDRPLKALERRIPSLNKNGEKPTLVDRLFHYAVKTEGCWGWLGKKDKAGYAKIVALDSRTKKSRVVLAHRMSWAHANNFDYESLPSNLSIDHLCRKRDCTNPAHLALISPPENTRAMLAWHTLVAENQLLKTRIQQLEQTSVERTAEKRAER